MLVALILDITTDTNIPEEDIENEQIDNRLNNTEGTDQSQEMYDHSEIQFNSCSSNTFESIERQHSYVSRFLFVLCYFTSTFGNPFGTKSRRDQRL